MTNTAIRRLLATSIPAALIAATTLADASTSVPQVRVPFAHTLGARPMLRPIMNRPFANNTPRTTFVAGGATLPALAYLGSSALSQNPGTPVSGSVFAEFAKLSGVTTQYCQTGSGFGRKVFDGDPGAGGVNGACPALGVAVQPSNGFGAPAALALTDPDITGTDVPMAQTEYTEFVTNKAGTRGEPVELPSIIGSIALLYNNSGVTTKVPLTDRQICKIITGAVTNWNQISPRYASLPLFFVYRADGSGTTFSLSNHLVSVCNNSALSVSQAFTAPSGTVSVIGPTVPINFVGETGNVGVAAEIQSHNGYIGYVEAANAKAVVGGSVGFATVNGKDPIKNLPETAANFAFDAKDIAKDSVVNTNGGAAQVAPLSPAPATPGCVELAIPAKYANITVGYPIIAVTNLLMSTAGNGAANAANLQGLVTVLNTPGDFGSSGITSVDPATKAKGTGLTGYAALGSTFNSPLKTLARHCIGA